MKKVIAKVSWADQHGAVNFQEEIALLTDKGEWGVRKHFHWWAVFHAASGLRAQTYNKRRDAITAAEQCQAAGVHWNGVGTCPTDFIAAISAIVRPQRHYYALGTSPQQTA